jgi:hypothetical protein
LSNSFYDFIEKFRIFLDNPYLNITVGLVLLSSGVSQTMHELDYFGGEPNFGVHHGVILFSLIHTLKAITTLLKNIEKTGKKETLQG